MGPHASRCIVFNGIHTFPWFSQKAGHDPTVPEPFGVELSPFGEHNLVVQHALAFLSHEPVGVVGVHPLEKTTLLFRIASAS